MSTNRRIFNTGEDGADGIRGQVARMEEDLRDVSGLRMWHVKNIVLNCSKAAVSDVLPLRIKKPSDCLRVHAVIPGFCRDTSGPVTTTWVPTFEPTSDGDVQLRNVTGATAGKIYVFSLVLVGE